MRVKSWADAQFDVCRYCGQARVPHPTASHDPLNDIWMICPNGIPYFSEPDKEKRKVTPMCSRPEVLVAPFVHGAYYRGSCRNASIARYNAATDRFIYWRTKFGSVFEEEICHTGCDDGYDLFEPYAETTTLPEGFKEIPLEVSWRKNH